MRKANVFIPIMAAAAGVLLVAGCGVEFDTPGPRIDQVRDLTFASAAPGSPIVAASTNSGKGRWRVVAIPGAPSNKKFWKKLLSHTPADLEFVVIERPGYGESRHGGPVLDFDDQVAAAVPLLRHDGGCNIVVGQSYGAVLAMKTALDFPDDVQGVAIMSGLVTGVTKGIERWANFGRLWGVRSILPGPLKTLEREFEAWKRQAPSVWARLDEVDVPVVILHGDRDDTVPVSNAEFLRNALPDRAEAELVIVEKGDHFLNFEHSDEVIGAIERLIDRAEARGSCSDAEAR